MKLSTRSRIGTLSWLAAGLLITGNMPADVIQLSDVGGSVPGFVISGVGGQDALGASVSGAGDTNGDGLGDVTLDQIGKSNGNSCQNLVVFGKGSNSLVNLEVLENGGFFMRRFGPLALSRRSSGAGDVNGDGFADVIVGDTLFNGTLALDGICYVVFGGHDSDSVRLTALGTGGFSIVGSIAGDNAGFSVSGAGDVNGDGLSDVILGAPGAFREPGESQGNGECYVVFGKADNSSVVTSSLGTSGFVIRGIDPSDKWGTGVSGAGDVNGDGLSDVIVSCFPSYPSTKPGEAYVVFGKSNNLVVELSALGAGGFRIHGLSKGDYLGQSVQGAGDVNGDGLADVILGAFRADANGVIDSGASYVVFGKSTTSAVDLNAVGSQGFVINGAGTNDNSGFSVSSAGDWNGDGRTDLLVGVRSAAPSEVGEAYIVLGKTSTSAVDLSAASFGGHTIRGVDFKDLTASGDSGAGDVNGDGLADVVLGSRDAAPPGLTFVGRCHVLFGQLPPGPGPSATYTSYLKSGNAPRQPVGIAGDGSNDSTPDSGAWIGFSGGSASQQTVTRWRTKSVVSSLGSTGVLDVAWNITTNRTSAGTVDLTLKYTDEDLGALSESNLKLYRSIGGNGGPWFQLPATVDTARNHVRATFNPPLTAYYAIVADTTAPTALITKQPADEEQDFVDYSIVFNESVGSTLEVGDLSIVGGDNNPVAYLSGSGANYSLHLAFSNTDGTDDVSFSITGAVTDLSSNALVGPVNSPVHSVNNYADGDINHDGAFNIADVAMLADINLGLATFP